MVGLPLPPDMKFIFYCILFYLLYKLIFNFIIPVYKASNHIKKNIRNAQAQQQQFYEQQQRQQQQAQQQKQQKQAPSSDSEYIDYEEVK
jgi:F0F1-type ATP synthase membrane subunit b/b'